MNIAKLIMIAKHIRINGNGIKNTVVTMYLLTLNVNIAKCVTIVPVIYIHGWIHREDIVNIAKLIMIAKNICINGHLVMAAVMIIYLLTLNVNIVKCVTIVPMTCISTIPAPSYRKVSGIFASTAVHLTFAKHKGINGLK